MENGFYIEKYSYLAMSDNGKYFRGFTDKTFEELKLKFNETQNQLIGMCEVEDKVGIAIQNKIIFGKEWPLENVHITFCPVD